MTVSTEGTVVPQIIFARERSELQALREHHGTEALEGLQRWMVGARRTGDASLIAEGLFETARAQRAVGHTVDAVESASQAAHLAESVNDPPALFRNLLLMGILLDDMGRPEEGLRQVERALSLDWQPPPTEEARAKGVGGALLARIGRHPQALIYLRRAATVEGLDAEDRTQRHMSLIWHLCDDLQLPLEAAAEWQQLRAQLSTGGLRGWLRTAYWATSVGVWSATGHTGPLLTTGRVMLEEHARHPHVATGWACAMALEALVRYAMTEDAQAWVGIAEPQVKQMRSLDHRRWLLALAQLAAHGGDAQRARRLRGRASAVVRKRRAGVDVDTRLVLAQMRVLEGRLALAKSERQAEALRMEIARHEAHLRSNQALPPSLLSELFQLSGRSGRDLDEPDLGPLGFHLAFQPFLDLGTRRLSGCEALLRLRHPLRGPLTPAEFIPRLDASGEIDTVGRWVLTEACRQLRDWRRAGLPLALAVNVTANQLNQGGFADRVGRLLNLHALPPESLELEITETVACSEASTVIDELEQLRSLGVRISVDDFGTGYSNFARLLDISPSKVKIDRSLVQRLATGERAVRTVKTLISSAHSMAMSVTAEGVETDEQARLLLGLGCDALQGYLIGTPQPAEALIDLLNQGEAPWASLLD